MSSEFAIPLLIFSALWGGVCFAILNPKGKGGIGFALGFFLGPLGLAISIFIIRNHGNEGPSSGPRCMRCEQPVAENVKFCIKCYDYFDSLRFNKAPKKRKHREEDPEAATADAEEGAVEVEQARPLKCPECNNDLKISKKDIGDHVRCWYCGETFLVMKGLDQ